MAIVLELVVIIQHGLNRAIESLDDVFKMHTVLVKVDDIAPLETWLRFAPTSVKTIDAIRIDLGKDEVAAISNTV